MTKWGYKFNIWDVQPNIIQVSLTIDLNFLHSVTWCVVYKNNYYYYLKYDHVYKAV